MSNREIPQQEMQALALINLQSAVVDAAFALFLGASARSSHFQPDHLRPESLDKHTSLELQKIVAAKALASEAYTAINLATRMAANFSEHADAISQLQKTLEMEFPELRSVRNSFVHIDERATSGQTKNVKNGSDDRLWGLHGNLLSVRGATGQLVQLKLSPNLPEAIHRLTDGIVEIFPKTLAHDEAMSTLLASSAGVSPQV